MFCTELCSEQVLYRAFVTADFVCIVLVTTGLVQSSGHLVTAGFVQSSGLGSWFGKQLLSRQVLCRALVTVGFL